MAIESIEFIISDNTYIIVGNSNFIYELKNVTNENRKFMNRTELLKLLDNYEHKFVKSKY
jgi:adenosine/AMP kinase